MRIRCIPILYLQIGLMAIISLFVISDLNGENLTITLETQEYQIIDTDKGDQMIKMDGFSNLLIPGKPMLLAKTYMIALPPGAEVISVNITGSAPFELAESYRILPAPPFLPEDNKEDMVKKCLEEWQKNYNEVYASDEIYPEKVGEYLGTGGLRKYTFARVAFFPFSYKPQSGKLLFYSSARVSIDYSLPVLNEQAKSNLNRLLSDRVMDDLASQLLINYLDAKDWYTPKKVERNYEPTYDYVIITTYGLTGAVSSLVNWKEKIGYNVNVVTTSWIDGSYSGSDLEEKIRNFLIDKYIDWGIEYVLLVGDIDVIPMRHCFPDPSNHDPSSRYCPPTDHYYADLTGNWDSDGDGYYGEYGEDAVDFYPEVYVGRIPWNTAIIVSGICQKLVNFEGDTSGWKNRALLLAAVSNYHNQDYSGYSKTDNATIMEEMITDIISGWSYITMYEKGGLGPSTYSCDYPLTKNNVINSWSLGQYGIVNWAGHGGYWACWRMIWDWDDGDGVPETENPDEMDWQYFISTNEVSSLDDNHPSIIFTKSCNNGWPEENNIGKQLIKNGSSGIVPSTRVSWYTVGWANEGDGGSASIDYYFFHYMINSGEKVGQALFDSKIYYLNNFFWWGWKSQQNLLDFCLYGEPALIMEGVNSFEDRP